MKVLIINIVIAYISLILVGYFFSDRMIFIPPRSGYTKSPKFIELVTADSHRIFAYYLPNKNAKYTLLVSHGNAEDIGYMRPLFQEMHKHGFAVFSYDYHGYGEGTGTPTERNAYLDVDAAYDHLTKDLNVPPENIIAYGHSVGAAVTLDLAVRKPVAAVILQGAFLTAFRVVTKIPIMPFDKFKNIKKIKDLKCPLLMIHGTRDGVVPFWQGKKLYELAEAPKQFYAVGGAGHNNIMVVSGKEYWRMISSFISRYVDKR